MGFPVTKALVDQLLADPKQAVCPACGETGFYDNRESPKRGKGPAFKCKNKECDDGKGYGYGVFDRELKKFGGEAATPAAKASSTKQPISWKQIRTAYAECVALALQGGAQIGKSGTPIVAENITTMVNSLMMTREKVGCWPEGEKKADAPKPAPKPAPPPPDNDYDFEDHGGPNDDDIF